MKRIEVVAGPKFIAMVKAEIAAKKERHEKIFEKIKEDIKMKKKFDWH